MTDRDSELKKRRLLLELLKQLESELRRQNLWQETKPDADALNSTEPFSIDKLSFVQWLQFIFIVKMGKILQFSGALPERLSLSAMAEEYFKPLPVNSTEIEKIIASIDSLFNDNN
ncbi:YqcC family protein [Psychromonas aquimarina]|uniref:YqcC family protein n=1 Tax=Psychromonas aquimarina TaxID=444919 RepID=UPI0003F6FF1F|nr:YqcC family protein [Psychromonas aquimarina]